MLYKHIFTCSIYRAIARALWSSEYDFMLVRDYIAEYAKEHPDLISWLKQHIPDQDWDQYCERTMTMARGAYDRPHWGGRAEATILSKYLNRPIFIVYPENRKIYARLHLSTDQSYSGQKTYDITNNLYDDLFQYHEETIVLYYHNEEHYQCIVKR
jgi:hypothetical protein